MIMSMGLWNDYVIALKYITLKV